jgi:hypothetical protein
MQLQDRKLTVQDRGLAVQDRGLVVQDKGLAFQDTCGNPRRARRIPFPGVLASLVILFATPAFAAPVKDIPVSEPRVHVRDIVPNAPADVADIDLGPAPVPGASRLLLRDELKRAVAEGKPADSKSKPIVFPEAVRIVRKTVKLSAADIEKAMRGALPEERMPRGAKLVAIKAPRVLEVPTGYDDVSAELQRPPRRTGPFSTQVMLTFARGEEVLARFSIPIELTLTREATIPDCAKGSSLTVMVRRGMVEIAASALASGDADVGEILQVTVRSSGRVLRARLVEKDRAEAVDG